MTDFKRVGTFEVMRDRVYAIDPHTPDPRVQAVVKPGIYPLYSDGWSYFWVMIGTLNMGGFTRRGDGMMISIRGDVDSGVGVSFPSKFYGADEFKELRNHPDAQPGPGIQRYKITVFNAN